jgi:3-methyladenine DNA glycosylase AlkD
MQNHFHKEILQLIKDNSGNPTQHTFLDSYLGNTHPRYPINAPTMRKIATAWMRNHRDLSTKEFSQLLTSLMEGESSTEKVIAGMLMDYATPQQYQFDPELFDGWLDHLIGWAEVDSVCTGKYSITQIPADWKNWKKILKRFSRSENIQKRRASLVLLCSTVGHNKEEDLALTALDNVTRLKAEKDILITKAISWILRSLIRHHKKLVASYIKENKSTLPSIAVRETFTVLKTGKKTKSKPKTSV